MARILSAELVAGYPLLENDIADRLGMSRTPVREAIRQLSSEGLVEVVPYKGAYVRRLSRDDVREIYETAEALEGMAAYLAAVRQPQGSLAEIEDAVRGMERALAAGHLMTYIDCDERFHAELHGLAANAYLKDALGRLYRQVHTVRLFTARAVGDKAQSVAEHGATVDAIRLGDGERARQLTQHHWKRVRAATLEVVP